MNNLIPQTMDSKELSAFYRIRFCEEVKKNFRDLPFYEVWPILSPQQKKEYNLTGWRLTAYETLREEAQKRILSSHSIGREDEAAGCFFLASEILAHPDFTKNDFCETMNRWASDPIYMFSDKLREAVLDNLHIEEHVLRPQYISKHLNDFEDSMENLRSLILKSTAINSYALSADQRAIESFSKEVFGVNAKFFKGLDELHGRFDSYTNSIFINADTPTDIDWAFWHAAFHSLKKIDPKLYDDLLDTTKKAKLFSWEDIAKYRLDIRQPHMKEDAVIEEMLADAFADLKTNRRPIIKLAERKTGAASRLMKFANSAVSCIASVLPEDSDELLPVKTQSEFPKVALSDEQFYAFADRIDKITQMVLAMDIPKSLASTAFRIVTADGKYLNAKLLLENARVYRSDLYRDFQFQRFDENFVRVMGTTPQHLLKAVQMNSPLAAQRGYAKSLVSDVLQSSESIAR